MKSDELLHKLAELEEASQLGGGGTASQSSSRSRTRSQSGGESESERQPSGIVTDETLRRWRAGTLDPTAASSLESRLATDGLLLDRLQTLDKVLPSMSEGMKRRVLAATDPGLEAETQAAQSESWLARAIATVVSVFQSPTRAGAMLVAAIVLLGVLPMLRHWGTATHPPELELTVEGGQAEVRGEVANSPEKTPLFGPESVITLRLFPRPGSAHAQVPWRIYAREAPQGSDGMSNVAPSAVWHWLSLQSSTVTGEKRSSPAEGSEALNGNGELLLESIFDEQSGEQTIRISAALILERWNAIPAVKKSQTQPEGNAEANGMIRLELGILAGAEVDEAGDELSMGTLPPGTTFLITPVRLKP